MTNEKVNGSKNLREEISSLKDENLRLKEELQLQKASWLYSHHLSLSIGLGATYGAILGSLPYIILSISHLVVPPDEFADAILAIFLLLILAIPALAPLPLVALLKIPKFAIRSFLVYVPSFCFFESLIFYLDPLNLLYPRYEGFERLGQVLPFPFLQLLLISVVLIFLPQIIERCGYRFVLTGSTFSFEVDASITEVAQQLNKLEEDFNLVSYRLHSKPDALYFTKTQGKNKTFLQFFLRGEGDKSDVVLVMHSVVNDIPMRTERHEVEKLGKTLLKWLEASKDFTVRETKKEIANAVQESRKTFYRQPVVLPSGKVARAFLKDHWKDILLIISLLIAFIAWLFPR